MQVGVGVRWPGALREWTAHDAARHPTGVARRSVPVNATVNVPVSVPAPVNVNEPVNVNVNVIL